MVFWGNPVATLAAYSPFYSRGDVPTGDPGNMFLYLLSIFVTAFPNPRVCKSYSVDCIKT